MFVIGAKVQGTPTGAIQFQVFVAALPLGLEDLEESSVLSLSLAVGVGGGSPAITNGIWPVLRCRMNPKLCIAAFWEAEPCLIMLVFLLLGLRDRPSCRHQVRSKNSCQSSWGPGKDFALLLLTQAPQWLRANPIMDLLRP